MKIIGSILLSLISTPILVYLTFKIADIKQKYEVIEEDQIWCPFCGKLYNANEHRQIYFEEMKKKGF